MMKTLVLNNDLDLCVISMFSNSFFFVEVADIR